MPATKKQSADRAADVDAWTEEEKSAMRERAKELKRGKADGERDLLEKIGELTGSDRAMAERIHAIITETAPELTPRTYYGMPAWAKNGKVLCFFQPASKFKSRYATFGFNDDAQLDDGEIWPTSWGLTGLSPEGERRISDLVRKAVGGGPG